jgi:hypothetical protein
VIFRDVSGMLAKTEIAYINKHRQGENWDRDASRVFQLPMKVIDERTFVEAEDIHTRRPDYDAPSQSAPPMSFKRLPTSSVGAPVAIRLELLGQVVLVIVLQNRYQHCERPTPARKRFGDIIRSCRNPAGPCRVNVY